MVGCCYVGIGSEQDGEKNPWAMHADACFSFSSAMWKQPTEHDDIK
jgi:hypothetical protein